MFLEPVFIFKYCTRSQLEEIGKKVLGFRAVRWLVNYCVQTGYLAVYKEYKRYNKILKFIDKDQGAEDKKEEIMVLGNELQIREIFIILRETKHEDEKIS